MYSKHLGLSEKLNNSAPFLRVPRSVFDVRNFPEEALKLPDNFLSRSIPCKMLKFFLLPDPPIISEVSALVSGMLFYYALIWRISSALIVRKGSLFSWGSKILGGNSPRLQAMSQEVFSQSYCFVVHWQKMSIGISSLISNGLTLVAVFPLH